MLTPSFIPPRPQRELRDLTRRRRKLIRAASAEKNRISKVLEDANIKLGNVLSDVFGVSGQWMLEALLQGKTPDATELANFAQGSAQKKVPALLAALEEHQMRAHHRQMIRFRVEPMRFIEEQVAELDQLIRAKIEEAGYTQQGELLRTLPAVHENAAVVLAERGPDPAQFPDEKHLGSWSGLCPGNNRSAGRQKSSHTNAGNRWLRAALAESAWGVSRMKAGHLRDKFWRIAGKGP